MNSALRRLRLVLLLSCFLPGFLSAAPRLQVAAPLHDFGSVPQGERIRHEFVLVNAGDAPLEIIDVRPACGCTTAGEWTRTLAPGATGKIPLEMETAQFAGVVKKTITVQTNDPAHPRTELEINVNVWTPVQLSSPVIIFPALTAPTQIVSRSVTLRHKVAGPLTVSPPQSDNPVFAPVLKETVPGQEFELTVTTVPPLADGTQNARITMQTSNPQMPELSIHAIATLLPPVQVAPTEILLPAATLSAPEKRHLVLLNHRGADLKVSDLSTDAPGVTFTVTETPDRKQLTVRLTFPAGFQADAPGQRFVRGKTNHPYLPTFEVPIVPSGHR